MQKFSDFEINYKIKKFKIIKSCELLSLWYLRRTRGYRSSQTPLFYPALYRTRDQSREPHDYSNSRYSICLYEIWFFICFLFIINFLLKLSETHHRFRCFEERPTGGLISYLWRNQDFFMRGGVSQNKPSSSL